MSRQPAPILGVSAAGRGIGLSALLLFALLLPTAGCAVQDVLPTTDLQLASRDRPDASAVNPIPSASRALYRYTDPNTLTVMLMQGAVDSPERVLELTMIWQARAGRTPIDRTATNTLVRLIEFRDLPGESDSLGLYAGAGFLRLQDEPTEGSLTALLRQCDLRLSDRSEQFVDRWGRLTLTGRIVADRDDATVTRLQREMNQIVAERLGYPRLVLRSPSLTPIF